jgi:hypothetical protein
VWQALRLWQKGKSDVPALAAIKVVIIPSGPAD